MKTSRPLRDLVPEVTAYARANLEFLTYNNRLLLVHEGQLRKEIEDSLAKELSPKALERAKKRVPSINLLVQIIDKLSRLYTDPATRTTKEDSDTKLLRWYEAQMDLTKVMPSANRMFNLHKCCALEPYLGEDGPALRVLPASRFLVYSDSLDNPLTPTVFIKCMGQERKQRAVPFANRDGQKWTTNDPYLVDIYCLYSDDEIIIVDSDGEVRQDKMDAQGLEGINPLGRIPFVYVTKSEFFLLPVPDTDSLDNAILIPKLLTDLNYAVQFQSHSMVVATDVEIPVDVAWNPDVILELRTAAESVSQGRIETIKPTVDIEQVLLLIETTLSLWLAARNIKTTSVVGKITAESASSGIAKIIDEADATQDRRGQMTVFQSAEECLWDLIQRYHAYWTKTGMIDNQGLFSDDCSIGVKYANMLPVQSEMDETNIIRSQLELGLINKPMALRRLNPHLGPDEITAIIKATGNSDLSLTGVQFRGLVELITAISAGQIPRDTGVGIISQAFSVLPDIADKMLGSAGKAPLAQPSGTTSGNPGQGPSPVPPTSGPVDLSAAKGPDAGGVRGF